MAKCYLSSDGVGRMYAQNTRESKRQIARFIKIGELAHIAGIDEFDPELLLGGFLELAKNKENHERFLTEGSNIIESENIIVFIEVSTKPGNDALSKLRKLRFFFDPLNLRFFGPAFHKQKAISILK